MSDDTAVTSIIRRRVRAGREAAYEAWLTGIQDASRGVPGYLGTHVLRPTPGAPRTYTSILRFASLDALDAWQRSALRTEWLARFPVDAVEGDAEVRRVHGVEFWFTPDGAPAAQQPIRWRMAAVLMVVVYLLILGIGPLVGAVLGDVPYPLRLAVTVTIEVALMTWVLLPRITRALAFWLFPRAA